MPIRFPLLNYPLPSFTEISAKLPPNSRTKLTQHLSKARYSVRLLRYWWAGQALAGESRRLGRPLVVIDLGCERGWLKHFTPEGVVSRWIGLDWNPQAEVTQLAGYDEVKHANFDEHLPLATGVADAVVSLHVFEHLLRPGSTMAEISRVLKPGGIFLGGSPTMPHWLAAPREKYFRSRLKEGKLAAGGHITVLSPQRWRSLMNDAGLKVEFITGSHAIRSTGNPLENYGWWIRLNQVWGSVFPAFGSECCVMARRDLLSMSKPHRLISKDPHRRKLWITLAAATCLALLGVAWFGVDHAISYPERRIGVWLDAHQTGQDQFILWDGKLEHFCGVRSDLVCAESILELKDLIEKHREAHLLVSVNTASALIEKHADYTWRIDSRLDFDGTDYLLLKRSNQGTDLKEYLLGAN